MNNSLEQASIRLDKWLWAARFYKTRTIAREMIDGGKVHYNGQRTKPSKVVELGAEISLRQGTEQKTVVVCLLNSQRRSASDAELMYQETDSSLKKREEFKVMKKMGAFMPHPDRKPNKKERRDLINFKQRDRFSSELNNE